MTGLQWLNQAIFDQDGYAVATIAPTKKPASRAAGRSSARCFP